MGAKPGLQMEAVKGVQVWAVKESWVGPPKERQVEELQQALTAAGVQTVVEVEAENQEGLALLGLALGEEVTPEKAVTVQKGVVILLG